MIHKKNNLAIFAHFDSNKRVEDYVLYYLEGLKKVADKIIFVSDCDLSEKELSKLDNLCIHRMAKRHEEYDFGSYKRGFMWAQENLDLNSFDKLILANDSCYGPLFPFEMMFEKMESASCDFWGITDSYTDYYKNPNYHIQSYFMVFKNQVFTSDIFKNFINGIKKEENKAAIIQKYEIGLSRTLIDNGFNFLAYNPFLDKELNQGVFNWKYLITEKSCPVLKVTIPKNNFCFIWKKVLEQHTNYPVSLIFKHGKHIKRSPEEVFRKLKNLRKWIISFSIRQKRLRILGENFLQGL